jgi:hypothetical protein
MLQKFKITAYAFTVFCAVFMTLPVNTSAQNGEEVEETCYDEFNIEIDCNDPDALHHGEGDGHANDGVSGGHAQPGAPHGEEVEETCYDEFNIEIDCNDPDALHHGEGDGHANDGVSGGHAQPGVCCFEGTAEFETCRIHGEGDGHANDGASGGHAQPGVPHGEEVEETCYDESNIEIDCNGHENDAVEYGEEVGYDDDESENDAGE